MSSFSTSLVRLIYASHMTRACRPKDIMDIVEVSRKNNKRMGVTGALCFSSKGFLQCLEGPREAVNELYRRIVQDTRNVDCALVSYEPIRYRKFREWTMACVRSNEVDRHILSRYGVVRTFDPCELDGEQAIGLLADISRERTQFMSNAMSRRTPAP